MHHTVTREQWLAERRELLEREKELTHLSDELARQRQELPWVRIDKEYVFETPDGSRTLAELFDGRSQLVVYHFMFGPDWDAGCPSCSNLADHLSGPHVHLANHDVKVVCVARAPYEKLAAYQERLGWTVPFASSYGSDFNFDFGVSKEDGHGAPEVPYNFGTVAGDERYDYEELPGMSVFALEDGVVFHTYSAYARGLDALWGVYQWLDRTPRGRNESENPGWMKRRDEYPRGYEGT
jgi:predicted dithiol-disulfide oxidoreductase (DUF899 family)